MSRCKRSTRKETYALVYTSISEARVKCSNSNKNKKLNAKKMEHHLAELIRLRKKKGQLCKNKGQKQNYDGGDSY